MAAIWHEGIIKKKENISPNTVHFTIEVLTDTIFSFVPGQFVTMDLPVSDKRINRWRSYSIANEPLNDNILEFVIVRFESGLGSVYLIDHCKVGDKIKFKGPDGNFVLPIDLLHPVVMISTGTGVAPFRSMVRNIINHNIEYHSIHLIFGTRTKMDVLFYEEFTQIAKQDSKFKYSIALSRENIVGVTSGYVHNIYMNQYMSVPENMEFYLCGWSKMIDESVENLLQIKKVDKSKIRYELYG